MKTHLFTVMTNNFNSYDILSENKKNKLEREYKEVIDQGEVYILEENDDKVIFLHRGNQKSLPND